MTESDIDALRATIQAAVGRRGGRVVAAAADITPDTLYRFLKGETLRAGTRAKLSEYAATLSDTGREGASPAEPPLGPLAGMTRDEALIWRGRLTELVNTQRSATETMQSLLRMFERATDGVQAFVQSNVLPRPEPPGPPSPLEPNALRPEREVALRAELDAMLARERARPGRAAGE